MTIEFEILGNQTNPFSNPIGYTRTLSHSWREDATKYANWCRYVRQCFGVSRGDGRSMRELMELPKPLTTTKDNPVRMDIVVEFATDTRPDMDNVYKGIADALFHNDKYIMEGSFTGRMSSDKKGRVLVKISALEDGKEILNMESRAQSVVAAKRGRIYKPQITRRKIFSGRRG